MKVYAGIAVVVGLLLVGAAVARRGGADPALRSLLGSYTLTRLALDDLELEASGTLSIEQGAVVMALEWPEKTSRFRYSIESASTQTLELEGDEGARETWAVKRVGAELEVTASKPGEPRKLIYTWERSGGR